MKSPVVVLGVPIHPLTMTEVLELVDQTIVNRESLQLGVVNAAKIVTMAQDDALRRDVLSSDVILADGMAVVWASRFLGQPLPERVAGIDLMSEMLRRGNECGYRLFCFGATEEVSQKVAQRIAADFPKVQLVGRRNGYYGANEEEAIAEAIARSKPDILLVAMTSPKKEQFLARWSERIGVPVCHGVGGSFDVMAGKVERAPARWQRLGLEWLYRVKQEPRRLWRRYLVTNTLFCGMVLAEWFGTLVHQRRPQ